MENESTLDDLLNGEQTEAQPVQETAVEVEQPVIETPSRDEQGRFAKTGEDSGSPPPQELDHAAIIGERRRRQEAEARAADLEAKLQAYQSPPPSVFEDEAGFASNLQSQAVKEAVAQATYQSRLSMSEMMARQSHPDFGDVWDDMNRFLSENPSVIEKVVTEAHPWESAYKTYQNHKTMQDLGTLNIDDLKAKMREEIMAEMQAPAPRQGIPSLSTERSVGTRAGPAFAPSTLSDFLR